MKGIPVADYRLIMMLLVQQRSYRQIEVMASCSHRAIARARRVLDAEALSTAEQIEALTVEDVDRLFADGRKSASEVFVPVDVDKVVAARVGRKKPPLKVLWARYLESDQIPGARFYGYDRFCEIVTAHVRTHDLTAAITHVPGHTMQVDWAGTRMQLTDPVSRRTTAVSVFVASLPFSGLVFAVGCLDEKAPAWLDAHRRAFEYVGGVPLVVVPDNASTASNQISKAERAREVNVAYAEFLEYYRTAAVPTRTSKPRDKGHVEAGVKVVTNWVIHYLGDRTFASLDELNAAIAEQVEVINNKTPFRGEARSRRDWFEDSERQELLELPEQAWAPVAWRKAKVHRDWHIQIDTIKYSVPFRYAGLTVDVRIIGDTLDVIADGEIIATHQRGRRRHGFVTDPEHQPAHLAEGTNLWTRAYFLRQGAKAGPGTVAALTRLLDARTIEAQGFRSAMNILDLGKRGNRSLLEQACRELTDADRPITYTAVKNAITALRAQQDQRPGTDPASRRPDPGSPPQRSASRDTSRAYLAGASAFRLDALTGGGKQADDA